MDIRAALVWGSQKLNKKTPSAVLDAEVLLTLALKKSKEYLYCHPKQILTKKQQSIFYVAINRRSCNWPVAYITGRQEFYGLNFLVTPAVLIPRPETELIIDSILSINHPKTTTIADIGTGSGCIAITLAKHLQHAKIWATDISSNELSIAKKNAKQLQTKINFLQGNLLLPLVKTKAWKTSNQFWIITANLPYLTKKQMTEPSIKKEPWLALFGGTNGLKYYQALLQQLHTHAVHKNKYQLFLEIDPQQKNKLAIIIKKILPSAEIEIKNDLAKQSRLLIINFST